jgi:hypothetical protein
MKMKIKIKKENIYQMAAISLFWGSLWGIVEATLGYLVHLVTLIPGIAGFIMFPIGFYFMNRAYRESGKAVSLFSTSAAAATIKLVDLFLPGPGPHAAINPALAILMEGAVLMVIYKLLQEKRRVFGFREALVAATGWRAAFILYSFVLMALSISADFLRIGIGNILRFLLLESLVNAIFITAYLKTEKFFGWDRFVVRTKNFGRAINAGLSFSCVVFAAAILTKIILSGF